LAPGQSADFTGSYQLNEICGETVDTLTARGRDRCTGVEVVNTGSSICPVLRTPRIEVTKQCSGSTFFSGVVRNTGDVVLSNVVVRAESVLLGPIELAPGETAAYSGSSAASDAVVEATAVSVCTRMQVSASATCAGPIIPLLTLSAPAVGAQSVRLSWVSIPGRYYHVESRSADVSAAWEPVPGVVQATSAVTEKADLPANGASRFYRVRQIE
jgi:hypothetical protein